MSGRRHHYIPQALLRGFARPTGKRLNAWMYRKGAEGPVNTNIKNIGVSIDFYRIDGDERIDATITQLENSYGDVLARVRASGTSSLLDNDYQTLKRLLANCLIRTARVREIFRTMETGTHTFMRRLAGDTQLLGDAIGNAMNDEEYLLGLLRAEIDKRGGQFTDEFLRRRMREQVVKIELQMSEHVSALTTQATRSVETEIAKGLKAETVHNKAIDNSGAEPADRIAFFDTQPFGVVRRSGEPFVLGDGLAVGIARDGSGTADSLSSTDELIGWVMPITSEYFFYSGPTELESLDGRMINDASIRFSHQFFLANERTSELTGRISSINTAPTMADRIDWEGMYTELARSAKEGELHKSQKE